MSDVPLRVVVCDEQPLMRKGVSHALRDAGFDVVATAADPDDLVRKARAHRPDIVVTDIRMPSHDTAAGVRAVRTIRDELAGTAVLILAQGIDTREALGVVGQSAHGVGYLLKDHVGDLATLTDAVWRVAAGGSALDPEVVERLVARSRTEDPLQTLTPRERRVLALMAEGLSNQAIADRLVVTVPAVERHVTSIFSKLGLRHAPGRHRRVLAVLRYLEA